MPTPGTDENESDFLERCISELVEDEGREADQATAMCHAFWNESQKGEENMGKTNEGPTERKVIPSIVTKVDEAQGIVVHTVAIMGNRDLGGDVIWPGAFSKTITERGNSIRVLDSHNTDSIMRILGRPIELREIGRDQLPAKVLSQYPEATGALMATTQFLMDTQEGQGAYSRVASGSVGSYSIGYDPITVDFETVKNEDGTEGTIRNLREIRLWEYSPVIFAMNPATSTIGAKAADTEEGDIGEDMKQDTTEDKTPDVTEDAGADDKEMTPSGPQRRLGDVLQGTIHKTFTTITDQLYIDGYIDREQRIALSALIGSALDVLSVGIPIEIAEIPLPEWGYCGYMADDHEAETKAGRVLAARNVTRLAAALATLIEVLEDAGIDIPGFGTDDDEKANDSTAAGDVSIGYRMLGLLADTETEQPQDAAGPGEGSPTATGDAGDAEPDGDPLTEPEAVMSVDEMDQWLTFINEQLEEISNEP